MAVKGAPRTYLVGVSHEVDSAFCWTRWRLRSRARAGQVRDAYCANESE